MSATRSIFKAPPQERPDGSEDVFIRNIRFLLPLACLGAMAACSNPPTPVISGCNGLTGVAEVNCMADAKINDTQPPKITTFDLQIKKLPYSEAKHLGIAIKAPPAEKQDKKP